MENFSLLYQTQTRIWFVPFWASISVTAKLSCRYNIFSEQTVHILVNSDLPLDLVNVSAAFHENRYINIIFVCGIALRYLWQKSVFFSSGVWFCPEIPTVCGKFGMKLLPSKYNSFRWPTNHLPQVPPEMECTASYHCDVCCTISRNTTPPVNFPPTPDTPDASEVMKTDSGLGVP